MGIGNRLAYIWRERLNRGVARYNFKRRQLSSPYPKNGVRGFFLARRCIHGSAPSYLSKYCIPVSSIAGRSHLCSAASGDLFIPVTNTVTIGPRAFAVAFPAAWNSLPPELHDKSLSLHDDVPEETENLFIQNQLVNSCVLIVNCCWPCVCDFL